MSCRMAAGLASHQLPQQLQGVVRSRLLVEAVAAAAPFVAARSAAGTQQCRSKALLLRLSAVGTIFTAELQAAGPGHLKAAQGRLGGSEHVQEPHAVAAAVTVTVAAAAAAKLQHR